MWLAEESLAAVGAHVLSGLDGPSNVGGLFLQLQLAMAMAQRKSATNTLCLYSPQISNGSFPIRSSVLPPLLSLKSSRQAKIINVHSSSASSYL